MNIFWIYILGIIGTLLIECCEMIYDILIINKFDKSYQQKLRNNLKIASIRNNLKIASNSFDKVNRYSEGKYFEKAQNSLITENEKYPQSIGLELIDNHKVAIPQQNPFIKNPNTSFPEFEKTGIFKFDNLLEINKIKFKAFWSERPNENFDEVFEKFKEQLKTPLGISEAYLNKYVKEIGKIENPIDDKINICLEMKKFNSKREKDYHQERIGLLKDRFYKDPIIADFHNKLHNLYNYGNKPTFILSYNDSTQSMELVHRLDDGVKRQIDYQQRKLEEYLRENYKMPSVGDISEYINKH